MLRVRKKILKAIPHNSGVRYCLNINTSFGLRLTSIKIHDTIKYINKKGCGTFMDAAVLMKVHTLDELTMKLEVAVQAFSAENYLREFYDFYEINHKNAKLVPSALSFHEALRELCGDDAWHQIAEETERLFGTPERVTVFDDDRTLRDELEDPDGLAPFFFVFDLLFCEYEGFTLCFISGTNN